MLKVGIVGHGFVGKAVDYGFPDAKKSIVDPIYDTTIDQLVDFEPDVTFIAVPTPFGDGGKINSIHVENAVKFLVANCSGLIVIKSTVTPDIVRSLSSISDRVIYNPEFLTERNANFDFVNPPMHIFGGDYEQCEELEKIYQEFSGCAPCPVYFMSAEEASFVKYGINCFLASKVLWMNQFYDVVQNFGGVHFETIAGAMMSDDRIGTTHMQVPGPDGRRGYGGACFPKDTNAFVNFAKTFSTLETVVKENNKYRSKYELDEREKAQHVEYI